MTSKTKIQILNDAFTELRINGITTQPDNEDVRLGLYRLEDYMSELTFSLGFKFESVPQPNTYSGIPQYANFAIASGMAVRLAPAYGKPPEALIRQASAAMSAIMNKVCRPRRVPYPSRQPLGMGNRRLWDYNQFMPATIEAPNDPSTEIMNVGDKQVLQSIDFSQYLQPLENIASYTTTVSGGLALTGITTSGASIRFTVQADLEGFQQILFSVTGTAGTKVNRTLNFNIVDSTSALGNP